MNTVTQTHTPKKNNVFNQQRTYIDILQRKYTNGQQVSVFVWKHRSVMIATIKGTHVHESVEK